METLLTDINWMAVVIGAIVAYILGAFWYSDKLFGKKWREGIGSPGIEARSMTPGMTTQAVGTFLLSWVIGIAESISHFEFSILIMLTVAGLIKANGFFGGKTTYAIAVEASYVLAMVVVMLLAHAVF